MFTRISRFFKSIVNAILSNAEAGSPVAMLDQSMREMMTAFGQLKEATATAIAYEARAKREMTANKERVKTLEKQAEEALKQGSEKLARRALQLQMEAKPVAERAEQLYKVAKQKAENARTKLKIEEEKLQTKIRRLGELKTIAEMNQAQKQLQNINDAYNVDGAMATFDKIAGSIEQQSDKLEAIDSLPVSEGAELDKELSELTQKSEVDEALASLKARLADEVVVPLPAKPVSEKPISSAFDE